MHSQLRLLLTLICAFAISACGSNNSSTAYKGSEPFKSKSQLPERWSSDYQNYLQSSDVDLMQQINDPELVNLVTAALAQNFTLRSRFYNLEIQRLQAENSGSALWPSLSADLRTRRSETATATEISASSSASLDFRYEIDLWQKLSASKRQANLQYLAELADFEQAQRQLVADVSIAWLEIKTAQSTTFLYKKRVNNAKQNLDIIESGYKSGLNQALDVYLARNEYNSEQSRLAQQEAKTLATIRTLERLVGSYPVGALLAGRDLVANPTELIPTVVIKQNALVPSDIVKQNPTIKSSWYQLLSTDASVAFAHKQRFPSFVLSASLSDANERLKDLFKDGLGWSILGNITAPIFDAGRLKNNEKIAQQRLLQSEQNYLNTLYQVFEQIENSLTQADALSRQYEMTIAAEQNALAASRLAFEQYQNGLVSYTTVLDAQSRAFDAQSSRIQLKKQLLVNQIQLRLAMGNSMSSELEPVLQEEHK